MMEKERSSTLSRFLQAPPDARMRKIRRLLSQSFWISQRQGRQWRNYKSIHSPLGISQKSEPLLFSTDDDVIGRSVFLTGGFDFSKFELTLRLLGRSRVRRLIDVGANIGTITVPAVSRGYSETAIAIEPDPLNFKLLECNIRLSDLESRVQCVQAAAASRRVGNTLMLERSLDNYGDHRIATRSGTRPTHGNAVAVDTVRLDDLVNEPSTGGDLVWMDVQGYEAEVLLGAPRLLESGVPMVLEIWPFGLNEHGGLLRLIDSLGSYSQFVDLAAEDKQWRPISDIEKLIEEIGPEGDFTDILVVA